MQSYLRLFKNSFSFWQKDEATVWAAAISYFGVFSLGPILLIVVNLLTIFLSRSSAQSHVLSQANQLFGQNGVQFIQRYLTTKKPSSNIFGAAIGFLLLFFSAAGLLGNLEKMFDHIWGVHQKPGLSIFTKGVKELRNFALVGLVVLLLFVSMVASTAVSFLGGYVHSLPFSSFFMEAINFFVSLGIITLLLALLFKILPDVENSWRDVWKSSFITSILFTIGKTAIGIYLGLSGVSSTYGAAASVIVLLLWIYYTSLILIFGAEISKAALLDEGKKIVPSKYAQLKTGENLLEPRQKKNSEDYANKLLTGFAKGITQGVFLRVEKKKARKKMVRSA